jgi:hypothetical protein
MRAKQINEFQQNLNPYDAMGLGLHAKIDELIDQLDLPSWKKTSMINDKSPNNLLRNSFYEEKQYTGYKAYGFHYDLADLAISLGSNLIWLHNGDGPSGKHRLSMQDIGRVAIIERLTGSRVHYLYKYLGDRTGWKKDDSTTSDFGRQYIPSTESTMEKIEDYISSLRKLKNIIKKHT